MHITILNWTAPPGWRWKPMWSHAHSARRCSGSTGEICGPLDTGAMPSSVAPPVMERITSAVSRATRSTSRGRRKKRQAEPAAEQDGKILADGCGLFAAADYIGALLTRARCRNTRYMRARVWTRPCRPPHSVIMGSNSRAVTPKAKRNRSPARPAAYRPPPPSLFWRRWKRAAGADQAGRRGHYGHRPGVH